MTSSQARFAFPDLQDAAAAHEPTRITRRRGATAILMSEEDFLALLGPFGFVPEVFFEAGAVAIWLPELAIWGRGPTFAEAQADLLDEIDQLLALAKADERMRSAPDIVKRLPWIYRLSQAADDEARLAILFAEPEGETHPSAAAQA
jgi:hypothetical protein